jgi:hypothetical protein
VSSKLDHAGLGHEPDGGWVPHYVEGVWRGDCSTAGASVAFADKRLPVRLDALDPGLQPQQLV